MNTPNMDISNIQKGSIVKFEDKHYRVSARFEKTVNLASIFSGVIRHRGIFINRIQEDEAAWYAQWQQSETYMSM